MQSAYQRRQCECPPGPNGQHCWHALEGKKARDYPYWLAICCWCGAFRYQENEADHQTEVHGQHAAGL